MTTVYLHVGFPKTGTSAIQNFFKNNETVIRKHKVLYPKAGLTDYAGQAGLAFAARMRAVPPFKILRKEIADSGCTKCVISSEYFFMLESQKINFLASQLADFDTKIIVYLRRQDARIESGYLQVLRDSEFRFSGDIEAYIRFLNKHPRRTDYYAFLKPWSEAFGKDNIIVKVYEEEKGQDKLVPGFLKICQIPQDEAFVPDTENVNLAYKPAVNKLLRLFNKVPMHQAVYLRLIGTLNFMSRHILGYGSVKGHKLFSESRRQQILTKYEESNQRVAREYLGRESGVLFKR